MPQSRRNALGIDSAALMLLAVVGVPAPFENVTR
jgi:hypothetical protein